MNNYEAKKRVNDIFKSIRWAKTIQKLHALILKNDYAKTIADFEKKYIPISLSIKKSDIIKLRKVNKITDDFKVNADLIYNADPLTKLMFAVLWKNGQVNRVTHLIQGIVGNPIAEGRGAIVFRQFGKNLANSEEPIIDQHVLRAYELSGDKMSSEASITKARRRQVYSGKDKLVTQYREWFQQTLNAIPEAKRKDFKYLLDKLLFCLGKEVKITRRSNKLLAKE